MQIFSQTSQFACGGQFHGRSGERCRRSDLLHEQNFVVVTVDLDITRLLQFQRNRPLDFADLPIRRQIPFDLRGQAGVAGEFPIGVPMRRHAQKHPDRDGLARNNRGGIRHQLGLNQLASFVGLPTTGLRQADEQREREKSVAQWTPMRSSRYLPSAHPRGNGPALARSLL